MGPLFPLTYPTALYRRYFYDSQFSPLSLRGNPGYSCQGGGIMPEEGPSQSHALSSRAQPQGSGSGQGLSCSRQQGSKCLDSWCLSWSLSPHPLSARSLPSQQPSILFPRPVSLQPQPFPRSSFLQQPFPRQLSPQQPFPQPPQQLSSSNKKIQFINLSI